MSIVSFANPESNVEITSFIDKDEEIWFKASEVAKVLGYERSNEAVFTVKPDVLLRATLQYIDAMLQY